VDNAGVQCSEVLHAQGASGHA